MHGRMKLNGRQEQIDIILKWFDEATELYNYCVDEGNFYNDFNKSIVNSLVEEFDTLAKQLLSPDVYNELHLCDSQYNVVKYKNNNISFTKTILDADIDNELIPSKELISEIRQIDQMKSDTMRNNIYSCLRKVIDETAKPDMYDIVLDFKKLKGDVFKEMYGDNNKGCPYDVLTDEGPSILF